VFEVGGFAEQIATGFYGSIKVGEPKPELLDLAWLYQQLDIIYVRCFFSREIMSSREDPRFRNALVAWNKLGEWWTTGNPHSSTRPDHVFPRETMEVLASNFQCVEELLKETEALNSSIAPGGRQFGLRLGTLNGSRVEHEFGGFRQAVGHAVMTGPAVLRCFVRRVADMFTSWAREGHDIVRADIREFK